MTLKVKVCGLREPDNITAVVALQPDYIGFIFYDRSPRFVTGAISGTEANALSNGIEKWGVFVDATVAMIKEQVEEFALTTVQLHGAESPEFCRELQENFDAIKIFKAFRINSDFNFENVHNYEPYCNGFVFDTAGSVPGGTGETFDWALLANYHGMRPFLLSGGIGMENVQAACMKLKQYPSALGIDINSRVEEHPGLKSPAQVQRVIEEVRR